MFSKIERRIRIIYTVALWHNEDEYGLEVVYLWRGLRADGTEAYRMCENKTELLTEDQLKLLSDSRNDNHFIKGFVDRHYEDIENLYPLCANIKHTLNEFRRIKMTSQENACICVAFMN